MSLFNWVIFEPKGDERGDLVSLEQGVNVPFEIKRVYYIYRTQSQVNRGFHAHSKLEQLIVCLSGSMEIILDNGKERARAILNSPTRGLFVKSKIWREMLNFSPGCVIMVLASEHFDEDDYIRDYSEFLAVVGSEQ
jgi:hypothetical protein